MLARLDAWMTLNPWHPRVAPFFAWILGLFITSLVTDHLPEALVPLYALQIALVLGLLVRYRRLTPELNLRFHWLAIPTAAVLTVAWIGLAMMMDHLAIPGFTSPDDPAPVQTLYESQPITGALAMGLRLIGMAAIVPLFEELFIRSAMLRGLADPRKTKTGLIQLAADLPVIGDAVMQSEAGRRATAQPAAFTCNLQHTPLGKLTTFGVIASTVVFAASHIPRDYLGCIACGLVWCWLTAVTNRWGQCGSPSFDGSIEQGRRTKDEGRRPDKGCYGLGPVIWSHALINAALWAYTLWSDDWRFL
jgi:membrane protease YdiL (CAAX protease family)